MDTAEALYIALVFAALAAIHPALSLFWDWLQADRPDATPWR